MNKSATEYKKALEKLTTSVISFEKALEKEMLKPSTPERGRRIALLVNFLTMQNQMAMHFAFDYSFPEIEKLYSTSK